MSKPPGWHSDFLHAIEYAIESLDCWEYGGADSVAEREQQKDAASELTRRLRIMQTRHLMRHGET